MRLQHLHSLLDYRLEIISYFSCVPKSSSVLLALDDGTLTLIQLLSTQLYLFIILERSCSKTKQ